MESFESNALVERQSPLVHRSAAQLAADLSNVKLLDLTIQIGGGTIALPHCGVVCRGDLSGIRCKFGDLLFRSSREGDDHSLFQEPQDEQRRFYTKYKLELTDLQIIYLDSRDSDRRRRRRIHILRRTPLIDLRFYPCLYSDDSRLARLSSISSPSSP